MEPKDIIPFSNNEEMPQTIVTDEEIAFLGRFFKLINFQDIVRKEDSSQVVHRIYENFQALIQMEEKYQDEGDNGLGYDTIEQITCILDRIKVRAVHENNQQPDGTSLECCIQEVEAVIQLLQDKQMQLMPAKQTVNILMLMDPEHSESDHSPFGGFISKPLIQGIEAKTAIILTKRLFQSDVRSKFNWEEWILLEPLHGDFFVILPKEGEDSASEQMKKKGFDSDRLRQVVEAMDECPKRSILDEQKNDINDLLNVFQNDSHIRRNIILEGHGRESGILSDRQLLPRIANLRVDQFQNFLEGMNEKGLAFLGVASCFAGGRSLFEGYVKDSCDKNSSLELNFPVITFATTDATTSQPDDEVTDIFTFMHAFSERIPSMQRISNIYKDIVLKDNPQYRTTHPSFRLPKMHFSTALTHDQETEVWTYVVAQQKKIPDFFTKEKEIPKTILKKGAQLLVYPSILDFPIHANKKLPDVISMIPDKGRHYIQKIDAPDIDLLNIINKFLPRDYMTASNKCFFIEELSCQASQPEFLPPDLPFPQKIQLHHMVIHFHGSDEDIQGEKKQAHLVLYSLTPNEGPFYKVFNKQIEKKVFNKEIKEISLHEFVFYTLNAMSYAKPDPEALMQATGGMEDNAMFDSAVADSFSPHIALYRCFQLFEDVKNSHFTNLKLLEDSQEGNDELYATLLRYAIVHNVPASVDFLTQELSAAHLDINAFADDRTLLMEAVQNNSLTVMPLLLDTLKADPLLCDSQGRSALHFAAKGKPEALRLLLAHPEMQVGINKVDIGGNTPLMFAARDAWLNCAQILIDHKADPTVVNQQEKTALHLISQTMGTDTEFVKLLVDAGADIDALDNIGYTPLMCAITNHRRYHLLRTLVEHGADVNKHGPNAELPLVLAASNSEKIFKYLLVHQADIQAAGIESFLKGTLHLRAYLVSKELVSFADLKNDESGIENIIAIMKNLSYSFQESPKEVTALLQKMCVLGFNLNFENNEGKHIIQLIAERSPIYRKEQIKQLLLTTFEGQIEIENIVKQNFNQVYKPKNIILISEDDE